MKVAMISYHTCPLATLGGKNTGGMNVYVQMLTRRLGRLGVHVDVYTRSQDEHVPHVLHDLGYGNRVVHIPSGPEIPLAKQEMASYIPTFVSEILSFSDKKGLNYDLIHSHYWMSGIAAISLKRVWNVPIMHMFHTLGLMKQRIARNSQEAEGDYRINGEREVIRSADRIVAATQAEVAQLQWLYQANPKNITIIPPGVDTTHFYPISKDEAKEFIGISNDDRLLLFVGRIEPLKGVDTLIKAIAIMRDTGTIDRNCCVRLAIIGGDPHLDEGNTSSEMARLKDLCEKYKLFDLISFLGKKSQNDLPYFYSAAETVIMPSHYESFGMVALEAMACGTPVIASEVGGLAFLVEDGETGFHFPAEDPEALSEKLTALIENEDLRNRMSQQASQVAKDYGWQKIATQIYDLYQYSLGQFLVVSDELDRD